MNASSVPMGSEREKARRQREGRPVGISLAATIAVFPIGATRIRWVGTPAQRASECRRTTRLPGRGGRTSVRHEQVEDVGADLARVTVPFVFPVAVKLPAGTRQRITVVLAPAVDRLMGLAEEAIGPVMGRGGHETRRGYRGDDFAVPGERPVQLDAHFQVDLVIQVDRDVPASPRDLLRTKDIPDGAAGFRDDLREFPGGRATAHDRQRATDELFESDNVFHANTHCRRTAWL